MTFFVYHQHCDSNLWFWMNLSYKLTGYILFYVCSPSAFYQLPIIICFNFYYSPALIFTGGGAPVVDWSEGFPLTVCCLSPLEWKIPI